MASDAWIGCSLDAGKGKTFVQLVGPGALFERKVLASAFGDDHEDALATAMKRAGVTRLRRNLAVAIGNGGDASAVGPLSSNDAPTCADPLVEEHVRWAVEKLGG
jgi:hypothetical protein